MKILIVDHLAVSATYQKVYMTLANQYGHDVTVITPSYWPDYSSEPHVDAPGSELFHLKPTKALWKGKSNRVIYLIPLTQLLHNKPDLILVNAEPENFCALQFALIKLFLGNKRKLVLVSWRNIPFNFLDFPYRFGFIYALIERITMLFVDWIIAFNQNAVEIFKDKGFHTISYIPMGVNTTFFSQPHRARGRKKVASEKFNIGYIGRFVKEKGVDLILRAVASMETRYHCLLVGKGPQRSEYVELARDLGILHRVTIIDGLQHEKIPDVMKSLDVVVLPSKTSKKWKEQFGRVLIEAMSCGLPVIGSTSGEIPNVVGDAGLIFQEGNVSDLIRCIATISQNDNLRRRLSRNGLRNVHNVYSWQVVLEKWNELFLRLCKI